MRGALLGLLLILLRPFALLAVMVCAIRGKYPWWLITPDDLPRPGAPHFGHYEPTTRSVYARFGRYWGDVYWLGWRNALFGLAYWFKPAALYPDRERITRVRVLCWGLWCPGLVCTVNGYSMLRLEIGRIVLLAGYKVDRMVFDPRTPRDPVNMEGRPILSLRLQSQA